MKELTTAQKQQKIEKNRAPSPVPPPNLNINEPPPTFPSPIICSNNTMVMISLTQMRQSNG